MSRTPRQKPASGTEDLHLALGHAISDKRLEVLRRVGETGSISQAAREAGISYKAAWQAIDTLTSLAGAALVERTVGGSGGGGARITPQGHALLDVAQQLAAARQQVLQGFAGGPRLAGGLGLRTSMRNQLPCQVISCEPAAPHDPHDPMVLMRLRTAAGATLASSLTRESADLLALQPGAGVLVLCKATAVNIAAGQPTAPDAPNQLRGRIDRISRGQGRDEVVLALEGGGHWVGFAAHPFTARRGQWAWAEMADSALVVGLVG